LRTGGAGIIYISHRLEEVRRIADRVTVIRDGHTVAANLDPRTPEGDIIRWMAGRTIEAASARAPGRFGDTAIEVRGLGSRASGFDDVSFIVRKGEILGLAGLVGAGRTELAETLFGLRPADAGEIRIGGARARVHSPADAIRAGMAYVPEDRRRHGVIAELDVASNTSLASLDRLAPRGFVDRPAERELAAGYVRRFNIRASSVWDPVAALSGGNQQKVALARWLATSPSVLILDEPTQGVDIGAKAEIHGLIRELAARGLAVLMISSDLPELLALSDRVLVMHRGRVTGELDRERATADAVMALALNRAATNSGDSVH
jgi:rhamnose transport system ATP-binding protein